MQTIQSIAKVSVTRPNLAMATILAEKNNAYRVINALRVYPRALISLLGAENAPKWIKQEIEDHLAEVGFEILT